MVVDPRQMLIVLMEQERYVAVLCRYAVVASGKDGVLSVAIELVLDPGNPEPKEMYYCPEERLERKVFPPAKIRKIKPYAEQ